MPIKDEWEPQSEALSDPSNSTAVPVLSDSADLDRVPKSIYVGGAGDVRMIAKSDDDSSARTWKNVPAGTILPTRPRRIMLTGTTATDILLLN